jgi:predicted PurR-regulated permease PerM
MHTLETNVVTPMILSRRLTLSPPLLFVALLFWLWAWGVPGALLAVPLLAAIKIVCEHVERLRPVAELLGEADGPEQA